MAELVKSSIPSVPRRRSAVLRRNIYDGAKVDRLTADWGTTPLTADQVIDRNLRALVARSRQQAASNDYMASFLRLCVQNIVGSRGVVLQAQAKDANGTLDRRANEALEAWWRSWGGKSCDVTGRQTFRRICKSAVRTAAKDGEFMIREITGRAAGPAGYALQVIDPQRCPVDYNVERVPGTTRFVRQGIEFSESGRPVAFYFTTTDQRFGYTHGSLTLERVPAEEIIHGFVEEIDGQRRGIPWAATSLWRLNQLHEFEKAAVVNARNGAAHQGFIEWADGEGPEPDEDLEDEEMVVEAEGGIFRELPAGARLKELQSQYPSGEFVPFHKAMLRGAGAGMGVAYVSFANDLEGVNFSSIRQGVLDEREHWMDKQEWLIEELVERVYAGALRAALLRGQVGGGGMTLKPERIGKYLDVVWQGRRWPWVDPQKDINAEVTAKNNLLSAPSDIIRKQGRDPETVWRQMASDINAMQAAGIPESFIQAAVLGAGNVGKSEGGQPDEGDS